MNNVCFKISGVSCLYYKDEDINSDYLSSRSVLFITVEILFYYFFSKSWKKLLKTPSKFNYSRGGKCQIKTAYGTQFGPLEYICYETIFYCVITDYFSMA